MKTFIKVALGLGMLGLVACKGGSTGGTAVSTDDVVNKVGTSICKKVIECTGMPGSPDECAKEMSGQMKGQIDEKKITFSSGELDTCLAAINGMSCDDFKASKEPPKGCEKLNDIK